MIVPTKKLQNGFTLPVLGLGTWRMGGDSIRNSSNDDQEDILAIQRALKSGITHIDTAEMYAQGFTEEIVGEAIGKADRKKLFIATKVWKNHLKFDDVLRACENSLKRLGISYIDLYLLHIPNHLVQLKETIGAFDKLKKEGLIKNIGVCNANVETLQEAQELSSYKIVCDQVHYNLIYREPERSGLLQYCQYNDIFLSAWRPLEKGIVNFGGEQKIEDLCQKYDKTPNQIALNWLISQKNVVTVCKMSSANHLRENLGSIGWQLSSEDIESIRHDYSVQRSISTAVSLR